MRRRYRKPIALSTPQILIALSVMIGVLSLASLRDFALQLSDSETVLLFVFIAIVFFGCGLEIWFLARYYRYKKFQNITLARIDLMSGIEFEDFVAFLYERQGYKIERTPISGDLGVDLIASRNGDRVAIQVKRYTGSVGRSAISDAVAGMAQYKCTRSSVVTNSVFTPLARKLAYTNHCMLIDRENLRHMISTFLPKE